MKNILVFSAILIVSSLFSGCASTNDQAATPSLSMQQAPQYGRMPSPANRQGSSLMAGSRMTLPTQPAQ